MKLSIILPTLMQWWFYNDIIKNLDKLGRWEWAECEIITIKNKLVNEAWNEWVDRAKWDYILIINDDIIINKWAIETMMSLLEHHTISCPYFTKSWDNQTLYTHNWKNICWFCFMFKKGRKDELFPIPSELKLRYWDNRLYYKAKRDIWRWGKIHHRESKTLNSKEHKERLDKIIVWDSWFWREMFYPIIK